MWLIRDMPALIGIVLSFWPLVIMVIAKGRKAVCGRRVAPAVYEHLMLMLPLAKMKLRHALWRQAFRAFGWSVPLAPHEPLPVITSWPEFLPRFEACRLAIMDLRGASEIFTDLLRHRYSIRTAPASVQTRCAPLIVRRARAAQRRMRRRVSQRIQVSA